MADNLKGMHFLVVDDDPDSRATIAEYLKLMGYGKVTLAHDGSEAIRIIDRDPTINFIISDWEMPLLNGLSLLQRVKANPQRANIPFLIVTSPISEEAEKIVMAAENLVDAYLIKPFRSQVLREKIDTILESTTGGKYPRALVVDDDSDARDMVIEYLKQLGFRDILPLANGRDALDYLSKNEGKVGIIISDWEMPEMSGIELLRSCKMNQAMSEIPFLMITSQSSIERMKVMQAASSNVDQYLLKPFSCDDIKVRVEQLMERAKYRSQVQGLLAEAAEHVDRARFDNAKEKFEEALKLDPNSDIALRGMGELMLKSRGVEGSLPFFKRAVEANPANPRGYLKLAAAYEQIGWVDKALALLQTALHQISFSSELHFSLGRLYLKKDMTSLAQTEFEKTLEIELDHQGARLMIEMLKRGRKD